MSHPDDGLISSGRALVERVIAPGAAEADEREQFPLEAFRELGRFGLYGAPYPERYGGLGLDFTTYAGLVREVAKVCASTAMTAVAHATLTCLPIFLAGSERLKERYLKPLLSGGMIGAFAMTEAGAGSDISSIQTTAVEYGDGYILDGTKQFITNANVADVALVVAKTSPRAGLLGLSLFVVEKAAAGFHAGAARERKLGMRASDTGQIVLCDARVPKENLIGRKNRGFDVLHQTLTAARLDMAAIAVGISEGARDLCVDYAMQRKQFGKPLYRFQFVKGLLADMETRISAADLLLRKGLALRDQGHSYVKEASEAKLFASETAVAVTRDAIQIHGAYGYSRELPLERFFRDAKLTEIGDGTSQIQRLIIADELIKARGLERAARSSGFVE